MTLTPEVIEAEEQGTAVSLTYRLTSSEVGEAVDGKEALRQSIFCMLSTDRYEYIIYSRNYGLEYADLIGKPVNYVSALIKGRIEDALLTDDRIESIENFVITKGQNSLRTEFTVSSVFGDTAIEKEFEF